MKGMLFGFVLGAAVGAFAVWYFQEEDHGRPVRQARGSVNGTADRIRTTVQEKVDEIRTDDIKRELEKFGMVVRDKVTKAGEAISDATVDARTTATIKGKLLKEPGLSSLSISVDTTDGLVTLSGTASTHEEVARAVRIALDTEGVRKVVSTLQVKREK
jgi:hyperosmotically inducible protein